MSYHLQITNKVYSKCTVVLLCYERHEFLKRAISYWSQINVKVLIIHHSKKKLQIKVPKNAIYKNYNASYLKRIELASKLIDTEFCLLAADDDFFLYKEILRSIKFLENNLKYKSYFGQVLSFYYKDKKKFYLQNYKNIELNNITSGIIQKRLNKFGKNYFPSSIYSVTRTSDWISNWKNASNSAINIAGEHEILYEMFSIISGKRKIHKRVSLIRSNEEGSVITGDKSIDGIKLGYSWRNNTFNKKNFLKNILKNCDKDLDIRIISQFFDDYSNIKTTNENLKNIKKYFKDKISRISIMFNLVSFYNILKGNKFKEIEKSHLFFEKNNISIDIEDLKIINEIINNFNKS